MLAGKTNFVLPAFLSKQFRALTALNLAFEGIGERSSVLPCSRFRLPAYAAYFEQVDAKHRTAEDPATFWTEGLAPLAIL